MFRLSTVTLESVLVGCLSPVSLSASSLDGIISCDYHGIGTLEIPCPSYSSD